MELVKGLTNEEYKAIYKSKEDFIKELEPIYKKYATARFSDIESLVYKRVKDTPKKGEFGYTLGAYYREEVVLTLANGKQKAVDVTGASEWAMLLTLAQELDGGEYIS